jgi:hypothetical protein
MGQPFAVAVPRTGILGRSEFGVLPPIRMDPRAASLLLKVRQRCASYDDEGISQWQQKIFNR